MPEKSGMDTAALGLLLVGRTSVGAVWPKAGDAIAVNAIHRRTSRGRADEADQYRSRTASAHQSSSVVDLPP